MPLALADPYATDRSPRVLIEISRPVVPPASAAYAESFVDTQDYVVEQDMTQLGNPCTITIGNPDGVHSGKISKGDKLKIWMSDPDVAGGSQVQKLDGIVTRTVSVSGKSGTKITVTGADKGIHLVGNDGPLWKPLNSSVSFEDFLDLYLERAWGFHDASGRLLAAFENDRNRRLNQGRAGRERAKAETQQPKAFIPPFCWQYGQKIAPTLIEYARREGVLCTVSTDGVLLFWKPNYLQDVSARVELHNAGDSRSRRNNVILDDGVTIDDSIDGVYTEVSCGSSVIWADKAPSSNNPHAGEFYGTYQNPGTLPFPRRQTFSDGERASTEQCIAKARAVFQRGLFDSWSYTCTLAGHQQDGLFFSPDTMWEINDTVHQVVGKFYCQAVKLHRKSVTAPARATVTLRKAGLLYPL